MYVFKKTSAFFIDISLFIALQLLIYFVFKVNLYVSALVPFVIFLGYNIACIGILKIKTLGLFVSRLCIASYDGTAATKGAIMWRIICYSIYAIPLLGWLLALFSFVLMIFGRGLTLVDILTKTQVLSIEMKNHIQTIYQYLPT